MIHPQHIVAVSGLISHPDGKILLIRSPRRGWEFPGAVRSKKVKTLLRRYNAKFKKRLGALL